MTEQERRRRELETLFRDREKRFSDVLEFVERECERERTAGLEEAASALAEYAVDARNMATSKGVRR